MFKRIGWVILGLFCCAKASAQQTGQIYISPMYPEYSTEKDHIQYLDSSLQRELVQFSDRRNRAQSAQFAYTNKDAGYIQSDSFVLRRIMDRSLQRLTKSDFFTKSFLGKTAHTIKKSTETDMQLSSTETGQKHKFDFKMQVFQRQAFIQYEGYTKAQLRYDIRNGGALALVYQKDLSPTSSLGLENTFTGHLRGQQLTLNIIW
jgi:hypothetical protein